MLVLLALAAALAAPLSPGEAVQAAVGRSVEVAEAEAAVEAALGRLRATGPRDPQVSGQLAVLGDALQVSASQPLSVTGEGIAARRAAKAELEAAEARLDLARLRLAADVRQAWVAAVEATQRAVLADEAVALAARLRDGAERRLAAGEGSLLDARLARLEESEALATWMAAVSEEGARIAALAALVGVPVDDVELLADPLLAAPPAGDGSERADVVAARHELDAARSALSRERAATLPPVAFGAFYEEEDEEVRAGPSVSMTLPVWRRNADGRAAARAALHLAEARLDRTERTAAAEQAASARTVERMSSAADRMDADLPEEARLALESVAIGYDAGELDLLAAALLRSEILQGQQAWLRGRRVLAEARIALALARNDRALLGD